MTDKLKHELERAEHNLCRHLEDLNDQVDQDGDRIKDHMTLDAYKDCLKSIKYHSEIMHGNGDVAAAKVTAKPTTGAMNGVM